MIGKIRGLIVKYWDILSYLFFGVLTTAVSFLVFQPLHYSLHFSATLSHAISWVAAVAFAFLTNKPFVFKSYDWSAKTVWPELRNFIGCRIGSGVLEAVIIGITVDVLCWDGMLMKILTSVIVVIVNYVGSKLLVFRKK